MGNFLSHLVGRRGVCEELADRLEQLGWPVLRTSTHAAWPLKIADMVSTIVRHGPECVAAQIDVFSGRAFVWAEVATSLFRVLRLPFIVTLHGGNLPSFARSHPGRVRRLLHAAAAVTSPSPYLKKALASLRPDILIIPNGLDLSHQPHRQCNSPRPSLVWLRAFHSIYNPTMAVRVLAALKSKYPQAHLTMVGPDKGDGSLQATQALARTLQVEDSVAFIFGVPKREVPATLQTSDIFINTTNIDNSPVTVLEAMAGGLCVVTTNAGGIPDLVRHEHDALVVPQVDPDAMTNAVLRILEDPDLAARLSLNGRATAGACGWSGVLPMWEELLSKVTRSRTHAR